MAIELISKIKQKNNGDFKLVDAFDVEYVNAAMDSVAETRINNVSDALDTIFSILNSAPTLSYVEEEGFREGERKYWQIGEQMRLVFSFSSSASGKCNITIFRNGITYKTFSSNKGRIAVDLGIATEQNNYRYTISAVDSLGRDAVNELYFNHILGGVEITSTFDYVIQNTVYTADTYNTVEIPATITYAEANYPRSILYTISKTSGEVITTGEYQCGISNWASTISLKPLFGSAGEYSLTLKGKVVIDGTEIFSNELVYNFAVINNNTVAVTVVSSNLDNVTTSDNIDISFRTVTNVNMLVNSMLVRCSLYKINEDGTKTSIKSITIRGISSGNINTWNIGRVSTEGTYMYELIGGADGDATAQINTAIASGEFVVSYSTVIGGEYETSNLIAYFDANDMDNASDNPSIWKAKNSNLNSYYYIKLHGLNYTRNGWMVDERDGSKMLKFTGDSYGELMYKPSSGIDKEFSPISLMTDAAMGNTFEIVFRTRCIGQMDACVASCRNENIENYGGYSIYYDKAKISSTIQSTTTTVNESNTEFTHVTFVIDKNIRDFNNGIDNSTIENLNTVPTMNIYVNGVRTKVIPINRDEQFVIGAMPAMQLILNAHYDTSVRKVVGFGNCEIKMLRIYNSALTAEQVLGNYINSKYNLEERMALINKNDANKADIPIVRFVRNKTIVNGENKFNKYSKDTSFDILNRITTKSSDDPTVPTSKNSWVNCTMWYTYLDKSIGYWITIKYDDVDVYLQGTSTLQFPIKNYKIKVYNSSIVDGVPKRGKKYKFIPPNKVNTPGWLVPDYTYTFKCDFMEESHRNNTPTAVIYETILDKVVEFNKGQYSPCKCDTYSDAYADVEVPNEDGTGSTTVRTKKYRDAINGFPILVYYNENTAVDKVTNEPIDYNELSTESDGYYSNNDDVMVGTMMFNVDKSGAAIGFEPEAPAPISVKNPLTGEQVKYTDGTDVILDTIPCVSLEGASNAAVPVAASFYTMDEANRYTYKSKYLESEYSKLKNDGTLNYSITYDDFYNAVQAGEYPNVDSYEKYCEKPESDTGIFKDIYKYISTTFDVRYTWTEELLEDGKELSEKDFNECTYGHIINTINWIDEAYNNREKFRNEFSNYFDFSYCATYYLQMMTLIQVDNAGKNAMFDLWFGGDVIDCGGLRPRPYDMDTQMCLNNSGIDSISISAEINPSLSPTNITGSYADQCAVSNRDSDANHKRYTDYNTPNSKFWIAFGNYFRDELIRNYAELRKSYYTADWICKSVDALTSETIGESFYNKDAGAKYLSQTYYETNDNGTTSIHADMLPKLNGNRASRYRQVLEQRIIFMDTWFKYSSGDSLNTTIALRSNANSAGYSSVQIGISVYSPCYVQIDVGTGNDAIIVAYIDTNSRYVYGTETYEGVLFTLPVMANDKDITIHAAGNIKSINHMENLVIKQFDVGNAKKLTSISIPSSLSLTGLVTGSNTYLRSLNVSGSKNLVDVIELRNCENLQTVDISNTGVTSIILPEGGSLKTFIAENCKFTTLSFVDLQFLDTININNCSNITTYELINCPLLTQVNISGYINLSKINIQKCDAVRTLNLSNTSIAEMDIINCNSINNINLSNCNGTIMNELNLSSVYGLTSLDISSSQPADGIIVAFPKYKAEYAALPLEELQELIDNGVDVYWSELNTFNASSSNLKNISYGIETNLTAGVVNFERLTKLSSLTLSNCMMIKEIKNLNYTGNVSSLFYGLSNCAKIGGTITSKGTSADSMFNECTSLTDISGLELDLRTVTSASSGMRNCVRVSFGTIKKVLDSMPNVTKLSSFLYMETSTATSFVLESSLFSGTPKVNDISFFFYSCDMTSLPSGLFEPIKNSLTSVRAFCRGCNKLTTVPNDIFKNCVKITNYAEAFLGCGALASFFTNSSYYYDIFPENCPATATNAMFYGCGKLAKASVVTNDPTDGLKTMFDNLPALSNAQAMFYGCTFITGLPTGLFERNTALSAICGMFAKCTNLKTIPDMLFNSSVKTTTTHPSLTLARGLFSGCTSLNSAINSNFFTGAFNLQNIGYSKAVSIGSTITMYTGGMFANTNIPGYAHDFLYKLTKLTSVSMLFFKGKCEDSSMVPSLKGNNNNSLYNVYIGNDAYVNCIYNDIFSKQTNLQEVSYCFAGNILLEKFCDDKGQTVSPTLFNACKNKLKYAEGLFANCTGLSIDVPRTLFNGCKTLATLRSCFAGCTNLSGSLPEDFLSGCVALSNTSYMFYKCASLGMEDNHTSISVPSNIFDSCRSKISNTSYMFAGCGFNGIIGTGDVIVNEDDEGVVSYTINRYGLLSECLQLTSVSCMFRGCKNLKGAIPEDMFFTSEATKLYTNLTNISNLFDNCFFLAMNHVEGDICGHNKMTIYGAPISSDEQGYLIPINWLNKCPNLTNISYLFNHVSSPVDASAQYTSAEMLLADTTFSQQTKIENASYAFAHVKSLAASLTAIFLQNSLNTLSNAAYIFVLSNVKSVGVEEYNAVFEKNTSTTAKNTTLTNLEGAFLKTNSGKMTGYGPTPSRFSALKKSDYMMGGQKESNINNYNVYSAQQKKDKSYGNSNDIYTIPDYAQAATLR